MTTLLLAACGGELQNPDNGCGDDTDCASAELSAPGRFASLPASQSPFGVNGAERGLTDAYNQMRQAGFGWVRMFIPWNVFEPEQGTFVFDQPLQGYGTFPRESADELIQNAKAHGFSVLVVVNGTPDWAGGGPKNNLPPNDDQGYANFITALLQRLGANIDAVELWNEPNLSDYWVGAQSLFRDRIVKPGFDAVKRYDSRIKVVGSALYASNDVSFISENGEPVRPFDAYGSHPYGPDLLKLGPIVAGAHQYAVAHDIPAVWVTEVGWDGAYSSCYHKTASPAQAIIHALGMAQTTRFPRLERVFIYNMSDRAKSAIEKGCRMGFLRIDGTAKARLEPVGNYILGR
jgi:hypothetical protein